MTIRKTKYLSFSLLFIMLIFFGLVPVVFGGSGYLDIISEPEGVTIFINNLNVGKTPLTGIEVRSGKIEIRAIKKGYGTATQKIKLQNDALKTLKIILKPTQEETGESKQEITIQQDKGELLVINQLGNIPVFIDNNDKGSGSVKIIGISSGIHTLKVDKFSKKIKIYKDHTLKVRVNKNGIFILNDLEQLAEKKRREKEKKIEEQRKLEQAKQIEIKRKMQEDEERRIANQKRLIEEEKKKKLEEEHRKRIDKIRATEAKILYVEKKWPKKTRLSLNTKRQICKYHSNKKTNCMDLRIDGFMYFKFGGFMVKDKMQIDVTFFINGKRIDRLSRKDKRNGVALKGRYTAKHEGINIIVHYRIGRNISYVKIYRDDNYLPQY